jgi:glycosyltransferase involved in cell wall biosynthesis
MSAADLSGAMLGRLRRIPVVSTRHFAAQRGRGGLQRAVMMRVSRHVDAQIAISHFVAEAIEGESTVVHAGVPEAEIRPVDRDRTVVVVQRLEKEKETEVALEAWKSLGDLREGWRLVIVGDGSRRPALEAMTRAARITDSVSFAGFQSDIASRLAAASIFVATAPREPYGLSVVEAMAAGTPVVATRAGGHLETVGSAPDAFLYAASDSRALAEQLAALMADPGRRRQYGDELRELQRSRFSLERQAEETSRVYQEVAS